LVTHQILVSLIRQVQIAMIHQLRDINLRSWYRTRRRADELAYKPDIDAFVNCLISSVMLGLSL
jgi:hypothetical protein